MKKLPKKNNGNASIAVVIFIIVLIFGALGLYYKNSQDNITVLPALPPVTERTNSTPSASYTLSVDNIEEGSRVNVSEVNLGSEAKILVYKEVDGKMVVIGRSNNLPKGISSNISISLNTKIKQGDVIDFMLYDSKDQVIKNPEGSDIRVQKPVGMIMMHYQNEY